MVARELTIVNKLGLHARAAAKLVSMASGFASDITVTRGDQSVNAKSIMGVMMLAAAKGTKIQVQAEGDDEEDAVTQIAGLVKGRFGEPE